MPEIPLGNVVGPQGPQGPKGDKGDKGDTGTFDPADLQRITNLENGKVDKETGKGLSTNDYTNADKAAVATIEDKVDKEIGKGLSTNDYNDIDKVAVANIGNKVDKVFGKDLSTNDYTNADKAAVATIGNKVDKETGKGLSTNDYTTTEKNKLAGIPSDANHTTIDATLSNAGQAADAKAAGDKIAELQGLLSRMEIYCEASGNPATFSDARAANVKALSVTLTPTQSGSGDPYPPGGGKNKFRISKNSQTVNGVTFTVDTATGTVTANGTATSLATFFAGDFVPESGVQYILNGCPSGGSLNTYYAYDGYLARNIVDTGNGTRAFDSSQTSEGVGYYIRIASGFTANNLVFRPMIRLASDTDPTYAPYSNIRPISGVSSVTVTRTGENGANSQSVTVPLVDSNSNPLTVYGGTLDVATGALFVTWANIASYNSETLPGRWISDRDVYASGTTPTTGAQVVYELATPAAYQLTPQQLTTLHGYNAVSSDAGSVNVTYKADASFVWGGG